MNNKNLMGRRAPLVMGLLLSLVALSCGVFTPRSSQQVQPTPRVEVISPADTTPEQVVPVERSVTVVQSEDDSNLVDLYTKVNPAVVNITVYETQQGTLVPLGQGSGFVYDTDGDIVTNAHVVHGAEQLEVTFADSSVRIAELVGEDLNSDLAVIRIEDLPEGVAPLTLGDMESLAVGQSVVAIGNPFGLDGTLTRGIISAMGRSIPALTPFTIPQAIQTDAAINPGNSGGPLLNLSGEVIGVNAQIETGGTSDTNLGIGFAIPVSIVQRVVPDLVEKGEHDWAWLGVRGGSLNPLLIRAMELPVEKGAYLAEVISNGPADKAGLRGATREAEVDGRALEIGGDVIIAVDGQPVNSFDDLLIYIALQTQPGQDVTLTILRDGEQSDVTVTLEERPANLEG